MEKIVTIAIVALSLTMPFMAEARNVDTVAAKALAERFLSAKGVKSELRNITPAAWEGKLYLFDNGQGYVLMSADDAVRPILAYSTNGTFPTDNIPPQVQAFIQPYADIVEKTRQHNLPQHPEWKKLLSGNSIQPKTRTSVGPLVTARWGQYYYYNRLCPIDLSSEYNCFTGCVATAMAQIMHYWKWPEHGWGQHEYLWFNNDMVPMDSLSEQFDTVYYQWNLMSDVYDSLSTDAEIYAVSRLMYDCGVAVNMNYSYWSSGAVLWFIYTPWIPSAGQALRTHFRYHPMLQYVMRNYYTDSEWIDLMKAEFDANRPVLYGAAASIGGHAFVADGYDEDERLHFNFGWDGYYDGYFAIDSVCPTPDIHFAFGHEAIIGICPNTEECDSVLIQAVAEDTLVGYCTGGGQYAYADSVSLTAHVAEGYRFDGWANGMYDNPHYFPATICFSDTARIHRIDSDTLYYSTPLVMIGADVWGIIATFTRWGIRIPASSLHGDRRLQAVQYYKGYRIENVMRLNVISGSHPDEGTILYEHTYDVPEEPLGWTNLAIDSPVAIDTTDDLWIVFTLDDGIFNTAQYRMSSYSGNPDGGWFYNQDGWNTLNNVGLWSTWMIRAITSPVDSIGTGVQNFTEENKGTFVAYPNPFDQHVFIQDLNPDSPIQYCILTDLLGRSEEVKLTDIGDGLYSLDFSDRSHAMYLLTVITEEGRRHTLKLIKQ